jgi:hypothetical protein
MTATDTFVRDERDAAIATLADDLARQIAPTTAQHDRDGSFAHEHFALLHRHTLHDPINYQLKDIGRWLLSGAAPEPGAAS